MKKLVCICIGIILMLSVLGCSAAMAVTEETASDGDALADAIALMSDIPTTQAFTGDAVSEEDLATIVNAGINAPSAMNGQPWHFSVITSKEVMQKINDGMSMGFPAGDKPDGMPEGEKPADFPGGMAFNGEKPEGMLQPEGMEKPGGQGMPPAAPGGNGAKAGMTDAPVAIVISCTEKSDFNAGLACEQMSATAQLLGYGTKIISSPTIALNGSNQAEFKTLLGIPEDQAAVAVLLIGKADAAVEADAVTSATTRNSAEDLVSYVK